MTDAEIIELYWMRSESAITRTAVRYGMFCMKISMNILSNKEDAEECVNDTYLRTWNALPPERPNSLSAFLGRITRNLSLDKYKARKAQKRGEGETALLLSELDELIPSGSNVENAVDESVLGELIDNFLSGIGKDDRIVFVRRYWYGDSISDITQRFKVSESKIKTGLFRTRQKLKDYLEKEGVTI